MPKTPKRPHRRRDRGTQVPTPLDVGTFAVYCLMTRDGSKVYTGYTGDFERRLYQHNRRHGGYTGRFCGWMPIAVIFGIADKKRALQLEKLAKRCGKGYAAHMRRFKSLKLHAPDEVLFAEEMYSVARHKFGAL